MTLFRFSPNQTVINCKLSVRLKLNNERARNSEVLRIWNTNFKPSNFNLHCFLSRNPMRGQSPRGCRKRKITKLKFWRFPSLRHICSLHLAVEWPAGLVFPGKNSYKFMCRNLTLFRFSQKPANGYILLTLSVRLILNNERARNLEVIIENGISNLTCNTNFKASIFDLHCFLLRNPMRGQSPRGCRRRKITKLKFWRLPNLRHICSLHRAVGWSGGLVFPGTCSWARIPTDPCTGSGSDLCCCHSRDRFRK